MNKKTIYFFVIFLSIMISCGKRNKEEIPEGILSRKKMVEVLVDVQIAEAAIQMRNNTPSTGVDTMALAEYKYVFKKHSINDSIFRKNFYYYSSQPELMAAMYTEVITSLSKQQAISAKTKK